nr:hypothetical protein BHI3_28950 [Bacteriovorax sp. HI3]
MKTIPTLVLLLGGLLTNLAFAHDCPLKENSPVIEAYAVSSSGQMDCGYVTNVEDMIIGVQRFSEEKVPVNLFVQHIFDNASFDGGTIIQVPERLIFTSEFGQEFPTTVVANLATVAHEYGHALLEKKLENALLKQFPQYAGYITFSQDISALKIAAVKNPDSKDIQQKLEAKNKELLNNKNFIRFARVTTAYSELYADVVANYQFDDKSAIFTALYYDEMNDRAFRMVQTRDFNTEFTDRHKVFMTEEHGYFAYTRTYIGKNLWPKNLDEKKVMLKKIGDAIVEEVRILLTKGSDLPDYEAANKSLIERLKKLK